MSNEKILFPGVKPGETFEVDGIKFFRFRDENGMTAVMPCESVFRAKFGDSADFKESNVLKRLVKEFLPKVIEAVGEENVCTFKTDLTALDGLKTYGELESKISLPTLDFYRANVDIFDLHKVNDWPWLATAWSAEPHYDSSLVLCVSPFGRVDFDNYGCDNGVRPILYFVSSIFGSCEGVTMGEFVDRKAVYEAACKGCSRHGDEIGSCHSEEPCLNLLHAFVSVPAIDPADLAPKGRWNGEGDGYADGEIVLDVWYCSECNHCIDDGTDEPALLPKFCPNCGARMEVGNERH